MLAIQQIVSLKIDKLSFGGDGIGRYQNFVVFVPFSAPGDELEVQITESKKTFARGKIIKILKSGLARVSPDCKVFGTCGGCQWQHISYGEQLKQKHLILTEMAQKEGFELPSDIEMIPSKSYEYRNRVQIRAFRDRLGFFQQSSHSVIDIETCPIAQPIINEGIKSLRKKLPVAREKKFEIYKLNDSEIHISENMAHGEELGFSQNNEECNKKLVSSVVEYCSDFTSNSLWDLYCGKGNFSIPLALNLDKKNVIGVEVNANSIREASRKTHEIINLEFVCSDVKPWLNKIPLTQAIVVLDPPRIGCDQDFLTTLLRHPLEGIVYISCNPSVLFRDLKRIQKIRPDLKIQKVKLFDMFPQTYHFEVLVQLGT
ncbi:MAG: class I SAM-dependent RNA methyltransferase [Bdellovibrionales bacterium]|nr:class I SAM-dependent RNA methyltransferase [Bdellovibrionales bacterium]